MQDLSMPEADCHSTAAVDIGVRRAAIAAHLPARYFRRAKPRPASALRANSDFIWRGRVICSLLPALPLRRAGRKKSAAPGGRAAAAAATEPADPANSPGRDAGRHTAGRLASLGRRWLETGGGGGRGEIFILPTAAVGEI